MITKQEIMSQARSLKLAPDIIEKDYILNWVLAGIRNFKELSAEWKNMLAHQISDLLPVEYYWDRLPEVLDWIYDGKYNE